MLLVHGGGYVVGSPKEVLSKAVMLAEQCGVPVFCLADRLGSKHPFPAGLDDCHAAWHWVLEPTDEFGFDSSNLVVGGYRAGGGLAAGLVQRIHDEDGVQPAAQLLVYS